MKRGLVIAAIAVVTIVLCLAAPLRQVSGDTAPGRVGGAVLRCSGTFDLARIDWISRETTNNRIYYFMEDRDHTGEYTSVFGPGPAVFSALSLLDFGEGSTISDDALRHRERDAAAVLVAIAAVLLFLACLARTTLPRAVIASTLAVLSFAGAATLGQALWQATVALPPLMAGLSLVAWREHRPRLALGAPAMLLLAVMLRPNVVVLAVGIGIVWALGTRDRRSWLVAIGVAALCIAPLVLYNAMHSNSPLPLGQWHANAREAGHVFGAPSGIAGLLVSPARGLVWFAPVAIVGTIALRRRSLLGAALVLQILAMAAFFKWHGGLAYGPRLLAEVVWVALYCACDVRAAILAPAAAVTVIAGQLGLWCFRPEQWETRRRPESHPEAFWDVRDNPIASTLDAVPAGTTPAIDSPHVPFLHCADGQLTSR